MALFVPGQSGNPAGRPKVHGRELATKHAQPAIEVLAKIMNKGRSEMARVAAANSILDRAFGKPVQPIAGDADEPLVIHEHRVAILADIAKILASEGEGGEVSAVEQDPAGNDPLRLGNGSRPPGTNGSGG